MLATKILLAERIYLTVRPVDLEVVTDFVQYTVRWNLTGGLGLTF